MISALVAGTLFRSPEHKMSKSGKDYISAKMKVRDGDYVAWIRVTVFSESAQAELMRLGDGDALSVQGH